VSTCGESLKRRERGWPIPPAAPRTATFVAVGVVEWRDRLRRDLERVRRGVAFVNRDIIGVIIFGW